MNAKWLAARTGVIAGPATSRMARQPIGAGVVEKVQVSSWPPVNWCRCRWGYSAKQSFKLAARELVSVPLGLQREGKSQAGRQWIGVGAVELGPFLVVSRL